MRRHVKYRKGGGIGYWVCQRHDQGSCSMMQIKEKVIIDGLQMVIRQILFQKEPLYTEMTDTIINSARKAHKSSIKSVNAKIKRVQRQIQQIKDDYIEDAITYEEYCHLSRQFIHTEPFLELEREEMIQENKCLAPIEQRIEEISQRLKLQTLYEHFNEDLVRYIVDEIELVTNKLAICRLSNGSEYYMFLDTWAKGTKRIKEE